MFNCCGPSGSGRSVLTGIIATLLFSLSILSFAMRLKCSTSIEAAWLTDDKEMQRC